MKFMSFDFKKHRSILSKKTALILGNGPSLNNVDFEILKSKKEIVTFSTNRIADVCRDNNWFPDFYTSFFSEPLKGKSYITPDKKKIFYEGDFKKAVDTQNDIKYITNNEKTICFVHLWHKLFLKERKNLYFIKPKKWDRFKDFPKKGLERYQIPRNFLWHSATTPLLQLCLFFKFSNIGIIGQDGYKFEESNNHYKGYRGNEHQSTEKIIRANNSINLLHNSFKYSIEKYNLNVYNLSEKSILNQYKTLEIREFLERF